MKNCLCQSFSDQAIYTWERLEKEKITSISIGEETLTDINLQDIQMQNPYHIKTQKFNRRQEAKNGADWEWWFCSENMGFGVRVQAKKLDLKSNTYLGINKETRSRKQIDIFIDEAIDSQYHLYPLYVFYNYFDSSMKYIYWKNKSYPKIIERFGCSILPAYILKNLLYFTDEIGIALLANIMLPWDELVCYGSTQSQYRESLPYRVQKLLVSYTKMNRDLEESIRRYAEIISDFDIEFSYRSNFNEEFFSVRPIPDYINKIMKGIKLSENEFAFLNVDGIMVINEDKELNNNFEEYTP